MNTALSLGFRFGPITALLMGAALAAAEPAEEEPTSASASALATAPAVKGAAQREARIQALLVLASDPDPEVRSVAIRALGKTGDKRILKPLLPALSHYEGSVRAEAVEALATLHDPDIRDVLLDALRDSDGRVASVAAEALLKSSKSAAEQALIRVLQERDDTAAVLEALRGGKGLKVQTLLDAMKGPGRQREAAAEALAQAGSKEAVDALAKALENEDWRIRESAARAFREAKEQPTEALAKACGDASSAVRLAAIEALGKTSAPPPGRFGRFGRRTVESATQPNDKVIKALTGALTDPEPRLRLTALDGLVAVAGDQKLGPILMPLLNDEDEEIRSTARHSLRGQVSVEQVPELKRLALEGDPELAQSAAEALADLDSKGNMGVLMWLLGDEFASKFRGSEKSLRDVREFVARGMEASRDPKTLVALGGLRTNKNPDIRNWATSALVQIVMYGNYDADVKKEAVEALRSMTRDASADVRRQAVQAVAYADGERAVPLLLGAAEDGDQGIRDLAIDYLGKYKTEKAVGAIAKALAAAKDDEMETPSLALARIGTREATKALGTKLERMDKDLRRKVLREVIVAKEPDSSLYDLIAPVLTSADGTLRSQAIAALGRMGDKRAIEPLAKIASEDPEPYTRNEATYALARVDEERAMKPFLALRDKEDEEREVKFSQYIEATNQKGLVTALIALLKHPTNGVRHQACFQLGRIGDPRPAKLLLEIYSSEKPSIDRNLLGDTLRKMGVTPPPVPKRPVSRPQRPRRGPEGQHSPPGNGRAPTI